MTRRAVRVLLDAGATELIHLGDIVQGGDRRDAATGLLAEWVLADAAFDRLDACGPQVPYLVTQRPQLVVPDLRVALARHPGLTASGQSIVTVVHSVA